MSEEVFGTLATMLPSIFRVSNPLVFKATSTPQTPKKWTTRSHSPFFPFSSLFYLHYHSNARSKYNTTIFITIYLALSRVYTGNNYPFTGANKIRFLWINVWLLTSLLFILLSHGVISHRITGTDSRASTFLSSSLRRRNCSLHLRSFCLSFFSITSSSIVNKVFHHLISSPIPR